MKIAVIALTRQGCALALALREKLSAGEDGWRVELFLPEQFAPEIPAEKKADPQVGGAGRAAISFFAPPLRLLVASLFPEFNGFILIMAAGIAVRVTAPLLREKRTDPAVVVMDEKGRFAVSLLSGHFGGANELAEKAAAASGGQAVITTATDVQQTLAIDVLAKKWGMVCEPFAHLKKINAALANGEKVAVFTEPALPPLRHPENVVFFPLPPPVAPFAAAGEGGAEADPPAKGVFHSIAGRRRSGDRNKASYLNLSPGLPFEIRHPTDDDRHYFTALPGGRPAAVVFVTNKILDVSPWGDVPYIFLRPRNLVAGVGCKKGAGPEEISAALQFALARARLAPASLKGLASITLKARERGLLEAARQLGLPIKFFEPAAIGRCAERFSASPLVEEKIGVGAVCEPAAWLAAAKPARLVAPKTIYRKVTVAVAEENCL